MSVLRALAIGLAVASAVVAFVTRRASPSDQAPPRVVVIDESMSCAEWSEREVVRAAADSSGLRVIPIGAFDAFESPVVATVSGALSDGAGEVILVTDGIDTTGRSLGELTSIAGAHRIHALQPRVAETGSGALTLEAAPIRPVIGPLDPIEIEAVVRNTGEHPLSVMFEATLISEAGSDASGSITQRSLIAAGEIALVSLGLPDSTDLMNDVVAIEVRAEAGGAAVQDLTHVRVVQANRVLVLGGRLTPERAASARALADLPGLMSETLWRVGEATRAVRMLPVGVAPLTDSEPRRVASRVAVCVVLDGETVVQDREQSAWLDAAVVAGVPIIDAAEVGVQSDLFTPEARAMRRADWAELLMPYKGPESGRAISFEPAEALPGAPVVVRSLAGDVLIDMLVPGDGRSEVVRVEATPRGVEWIPPGPGMYRARAAEESDVSSAVLLVRESRTEMLDRTPRTAQLSRLADATGGSIINLDQALAWIHAGRPVVDTGSVDDGKPALARWFAAGALLCAFASWLSGLLPRELR